MYSADMGQSVGILIRLTPWYSSILLCMELQQYNTFAAWHIEYWLQVLWLFKTLLGIWFILILIIKIRNNILTTSRISPNSSIRVEISFIPAYEFHFFDQTPSLSTNKVFLSLIDSWMKNLFCNIFLSVDSFIKQNRRRWKNDLTR